MRKGGAIEFLVVPEIVPRRELSVCCVHVRWREGADERSVTGRREKVAIDGGVSMVLGPLFDAGEDLAVRDLLSHQAEIGFLSDWLWAVVMVR